MILCRKQVLNQIMEFLIGSHPGEKNYLVLMILIFEMI